MAQGEPVSHWERRKWRYAGTFFHVYVVNIDGRYQDEIVVDTPGGNFALGTFTISTIPLLTRQELVEFGEGLAELGRTGMISTAINIDRQSEV